jgi:hypothetical protein
MADAKHWRAAAATIRNDNAKAIVLLDEELRVVRFLGAGAGAAAAVRLGALEGKTGGPTRITLAQ